MLLLIVAAHAADPNAVDRADAANRVLQQVRAAQVVGTATSEDVYRWSVRVMEAELAAGDASAAHDHVARMRDLAQVVTQQIADGLVPAVVADQVRWFQLEAERVAATGPTPPARPPAPAPAPSGGDVEACFQGCDGAFKTCSQAAEHFRVGVGALEPHAECEKAAEAACGPGRNQTATDCRARENRACQAERKRNACALAQTQCNARCR